MVRLQLRGPIYFNSVFFTNLSNLNSYNNLVMYTCDCQFHQSHANWHLSSFKIIELNGEKRINKHLVRMCTVCIINNRNRNVCMCLNTQIFPTTGYARVL